MKHKSSHASTNKTAGKFSDNNMQSMVNYTRSKDAYDGNMEITNLKSSSQKISGMASSSVESLAESTRSIKDEPGGA